MKLHFYSNKTMLYKHLPKQAPHWKLLQVWRDIAPQLGVEIKIGPSPREDEIQKYRAKYTSYSHELPARHKTILEVKDKLIYFDAVDHNVITAELHKVPGLFDFCVKFQYCDGKYDDVPFKVVPFTYFTPNSNKSLLEFRQQRVEVLKEKKFEHSILWAGKRSVGNRRAINKYLNAHTKRSLRGRWRLEEYYRHICDSVVLASARGTGEFCHRDMECMSIGTPFFRKTLINRTHNPLLPNVHYYTIGKDVGMNKTLEHFCSFFEPDGQLQDFSNEEWDHYRMIVNEGIKWYDENASPEGSLKLLLHILEENGV